MHKTRREKAEAHSGLLHAEHGPREREALIGAKVAAAAPPQPHFPPEGWGCISSPGTQKGQVWRRGHWCPFCSSLVQNSRQVFGGNYAHGTHFSLDFLSKTRRGMSTVNAVKLCGARSPSMSTPGCSVDSSLRCSVTLDKNFMTCRAYSRGSIK